MNLYQVCFKYKDPSFVVAPDPTSAVDLVDKALALKGYDMPNRALDCVKLVASENSAYKTTMLYITKG